MKISFFDFKIILIFSNLDPTQDKKKQISYLDLLRCGGKSHRLAAKKKKEKPKAKYRS